MFQVFENLDCTVLCASLTPDGEAVSTIVNRISEGYHVNMNLDGMPLVVGADGLYTVGVPIGQHAESSASEPAVVLYNHFNFTVRYSYADGKFRIMGFEITPSSVRYGQPMAAGDSCAEKDTGGSPLILVSGQPASSVTYSYSVHWSELSEYDISLRLDYYRMSEGSRVHWFSILSSLIVLLLLCGMVVMILMRTLRNDFNRYAELENAAEAQEETGWKLVHGDVFRPPAFPMLFSVMVGSGLQMLGMVFCTVLFSVLGLVSPGARGAIMESVLIMYVLLSAVAGYFAARMYKMLRGKEWKQLAILNITLFPGIIGLVYLLLDLAIYTRGSSGALPFGVLLRLFVIYFGASAPLSFLGAYFGTKKPAAEFPVNVNMIPRHIPSPQPFYYRFPIASLLAGAFPFGAVLIELFFILSSVWKQEIYMMFGFLFVVIFVLIVTSAEVSVVLVYLLLCSENYHWWWSSFLSGACAAVFMFLYCLMFVFQLHVTGVLPLLLFLGYSFIVCLVFFLMSGSVSFWAAYFFVCKIYSSIKID